MEGTEPLMEQDEGKIPPNKKIDCLTMEVQIDQEQIEAIIDTGAGGSMISKTFLESIGREIDYSSNVDLIDVNGGRKRVQSNLVSTDLWV